MEQQDLCTEAHNQYYELENCININNIKASNFVSVNFVKKDAVIGVRD